MGSVQFSPTRCTSCNRVNYRLLHDTCSQCDVIAASRRLLDAHGADEQQSATLDLESAIAMAGVP